MICCISVYRFIIDIYRSFTETKSKSKTKRHHITPVLKRKRHKINVIAHLFGKKGGTNMKRNQRNLKRNQCNFWWVINVNVPNQEFQDSPRITNLQNIFSIETHHVRCVPLNLQVHQ